MSDKDEEIIYRLKIIRKEHERDKYTTYSYILFASGFALLGLSFISPHLPGRVLFLIVAIVLFAWTWVMRRRARSV